MIRNRRINPGILSAALSAGLLVAVISIPAPARAQMISKPYIAVFGGQSQGNWSHGIGSQSLDWRGLKAVEVGFEVFGLTLSPGLMAVDNIQWSSADGNVTYNLQYSAIYLNLGAREEMGLYFAGGLNFTFWDVLPQSVGADYSLEANGEIGFQAFLGFVISLVVIPLKFMLEAGYGQFNGDAKSLPGVPPTFNQVSSTGPIVRFGIGFGR